LAKEKSKVYKAVFMDRTFPVGKSIRSTDLKDIVSELKSLQ
jgi:hypothetical protein